MKAKDVKKVGVVGAGLIGHGLALNSAIWGYHTMINDVSDGILKKCMENIHLILNIFISQRLIDQKRADETLKRIKPTRSLEELAAYSDFITEAIIENSQEKRALFRNLDKMCPPHTIIASTTSTLVLSDFGQDCSRQDKLILTHYFSPSAIVPGVEVAKGPGTSDETLEIVIKLLKFWHKVPIRVLKEVPGYLINRLQFALAQESWKLWADGVATAEEIDKGVRATMGFRMTQEGPFKRGEMAGMWNWPEDLRLKLGLSMLKFTPPTTEQLDKIKNYLISGKPWFLNSQNMESSYTNAYNYYAQRLKNDYWMK